MLHVGYRIEQDDSSLFSYTFHSHVLTIDPVSTGEPGWKEFLKEYNQFCSDHDGKPLFNQSWGLTPSRCGRPSATGSTGSRAPEPLRPERPAPELVLPRALPAVARRER